ncbi:hypothetical protein Clacol_000324 [Clathrus columnatus]|uniref:Conserved oligomeric Golgi complex subunit 5 n=1 Tax=Clathrus columnatus TaxID=1419009 RepID=A0AAV4ZWZ0_9AGAM|nr:hypothetical protein Clacol_000324 [Clathrus columnatus]
MLMTDYSVFSRPEFDPNDYANAVLAGEPYSAQSSKTPHTKSSSATTRGTGIELPKEDISLALTKLNLGIDDVAKQLRAVVTTYHETLLIRAAGAMELQQSLAVVRRGLTEVTQSLEKLRQKIRIPYQTLESHVSRLRRLQLASDVLRRTSRFVIVARRLEIQMGEVKKHQESNVKENSNKLNGQRKLSIGPGDDDHEGEKERNLARAALKDLSAGPDSPSEAGSETESSSITEPDAIPLRSISVVSSYIPALEAAHAQVTSEMESMVMSGLATMSLTLHQNQSLLASSLQTAFNLRQLPQLVQSLIEDLSETVQERIQYAFDVARISKETNAKGNLDMIIHIQSRDLSYVESVNSQGLIYKSRIRTEPTNLTAPQWTSALWGRLETLVEDLSSCCIKVYALEKVLNVKKDATSQKPFLDEVMKTLDNKPSTTFWTVVSRSLEKHSKEASKNSSFLQQTLGVGYPRLLRLFHDFFAKIALHTDTSYTPTFQSPETVLTLRSVSHFESFYMTRSLNRLNESVGQAMSGGLRAPPSGAEGLAIARTVTNELDSAKFDPLLVRSVAKNVVVTLDGFINRIDTMIVRERSATSMLGPVASPQLVLNSQLISAMYSCWTQLDKLKDEHTEAVYIVFEPSIRTIQHLCERTYEPLLLAIRREISSIIARVHRVDFGKLLETASPGMGGATAYMKELVEKLSFIRKEILNRFNLGEVSNEWTVHIAKHALKTFVYHVSIVKPLSEGGKLQLTTDMAEIEFALNAFMLKQGQKSTKLEALGNEYRALRALRPLLFLDNAHLGSVESTIGLPPLVVLHHILVRSPIPLPHTLHGWHEAEYVRWVEEHTEEESWTLIESGLTHWEKLREGEGDDGEEYVHLARTVLRNAKLVA